MALQAVEIVAVLYSTLTLELELRFNSKMISVRVRFSVGELLFNSNMIYCLRCIDITNNNAARVRVIVGVRCIVSVRVKV